MTTFTVSTTTDIVNPNDGVLSLREAVTLANATSVADTIVFASGLEGQNLILTAGELVLSQDVTIDGDSNNDGNKVTIDANHAGRAIDGFGGGVDLALQDLALVNGETSYGASGGAIDFSGRSLTVINCDISHNASTVYYNPSTGRDYFGSGGAISASGSTVEIVNSRLDDNDLATAGGAIYVHGGSLTVRGSDITNNATHYGGGGGISAYDSTVKIEGSSLSGNNAIHPFNERGGAISSSSGSVTILGTTIDNNSSQFGGGVSSFDGLLTIVDSTIVANFASGGDSIAEGGGILTDSLVLRNSTITGNIAGQYESYGGGGIFVRGSLDVANSIVSGNRAPPLHGSTTTTPDIYGTISISNGHNIFGSDVLGNNPADREKIAASAIFANIDPETGGGQLNAVGIVPLLNNTNNPALSGADPLAAGATGQTGDNSRPLPVGSLPDIGSIEITHALSTTTSARNDVITGNSAANTLNGDLGNDYLKGLGGKDTLNGGDGSDLLDGGTANDKLNGGGGIDLATFAGSTKVTFDLGTSTAKRGSETDTLTGLEGAIGSTAGDVFKGNGFNNYFQGGLGKDTFTGGSGRDLYDFNAVAESGVGATKRDVITDFDHLVDDIDLMGIDANTTIAGNQAFRWVGTAALTGAGRARLLHLRRQHNHPRQQRRGRRQRVPDPAHRNQGADGRRLLPLNADEPGGAPTAG